MGNNWYLVLELEFDPPIHDERYIEEKIEEKRKLWAKNHNDLAVGIQYSAWLSQIKQIQKDMLGSGNRRNELAILAKQEKYKAVDNCIEMIAESQNNVFKKAIIEKISKIEQFSFDFVKERVLSLGLSLEDENHSEYERLYEKYYKEKPEKTIVFDQMKPLLDVFGVENLYEFLYLGLENTEACYLNNEILCKRASSLKKEKYIKNDSLSSYTSKLCGHASLIFENNKEKERYDLYLQYLKRRKIFEKTKYYASVLGSVDSNFFTQSLEVLKSALPEEVDEKKAFLAFLEMEKIQYILPIMIENQREFCYCRCGFRNLEDKNREFCGLCGTPLFITCPDCGEKNPNSSKFCFCGFRFIALNQVIAYCKEAELAYSNLNFDESKLYLSMAEQCWGKYPEIQIIREKSILYQQHYEEALFKLDRLILEKKFLEADEKILMIKECFPSYSNKMYEKLVKNSIVQAKKLFGDAKKTTDKENAVYLCKKYLEICSDFYDVLEIIPEPEPVRGFFVEIDPEKRCNRIYWHSFDNHSLTYHLVKSKKQRVVKIGDGEKIFQGNSDFYADFDINSGEEVYYNVFVEQFGLFSLGASGIIERNVNFFEVSNLSIYPSDKSLKLQWGDLPQDGRAEIYEILQTGKKNHLKSTFSTEYLCKNLVNLKKYHFSVSVTYQSRGEAIETKGVRVTGMPICPPKAIDTLKVVNLSQEEFEVSWINSPSNEVNMYISSEKPCFYTNDFVEIDYIEEQITQIQTTSIQQSIQKNSIPSEQRCTFIYGGESSFYILAAVLDGEFAVIGNVVHVSRKADIRVKSMRAINGKGHIFLEYPENCIGFQILYRFDQYPLDIDDNTAVKKYTPLNQFLESNALLIDKLEHKNYYISIFTEYRDEFAQEFSSGVQIDFKNEEKTTIYYSFTMQKRFLFSTTLLIQFEANRKQFFLPEIQFMIKQGEVPMFQDQADVFCEIPCQNISDVAVIQVVLPPNLPPHSYMRAFLKDDSLANCVQLRLKEKSSYKIT